MISLKSRLYVLLVVCLALCAGERALGAVSSQGEDEKKNSESIGLHKEIVALVNGKEIHRKDFVEALITQFGTRFLSQYIEDFLIETEAERLGVSIDRDLLDKDVEREVKKMLEARYRGDREAMERQLAQQGYTLESWKDNIRGLRRFNLLSREVIKKTRVVAEKDILKIFEQKFGENGIKYEVRHILSSTSLSRSNLFTVKEYREKLPQIEKESEERASSLLSRVEQGEDFSELAKIESDDIGSRSQGGLLDDLWSNRFGKLFEELVEKLKIGQVGGPVKTRHGYHIVKVEPEAQHERVHVRQIFVLADAEAGADVDARAEADRKAREEAEKIYQAIKGGADFREVAIKESDDPGSREKGGDLGYISQGDRIPEFEKAAFSLKVGELSKPVRSKYGYHIIQVLDKLIVPEGKEKKIRHILISTQFSKIRERMIQSTIEDQAREKVETILKELRNGADFVALAKKESDDAVSRKYGGMIRNYTPNRYGPEFDAAVKQLKEDEISGVVRTRAGFHIIKMKKIIETDFDAVKHKIREEEEGREPNALEVGRLRERLRNSAEITR